MTQMEVSKNLDRLIYSLCKDCEKTYCENCKFSKTVLYIKEKMISIKTVADHIHNIECEKCKKYAINIEKCELQSKCLKKVEEEIRRWKDE